MSFGLHFIVLLLVVFVGLSDDEGKGLVHGSVQYSASTIDLPQRRNPSLNPFLRPLVPNSRHFLQRLALRHRTAQLPVISMPIFAHARFVESLELDRWVRAHEMRLISGQVHGDLAKCVQPHRLGYNVHVLSRMHLYTGGEAR